MLTVPLSVLHSTQCKVRITLSISDDGEDRTVPQDIQCRCVYPGFDVFQIMLMNDLTTLTMVVVVCNFQFVFDSLFEIACESQKGGSWRVLVSIKKLDPCMSSMNMIHSVNAFILAQACVNMREDLC